jgi:hypothetical protein
MSANEFSHRYRALLIVLLALSAATLACWSSDTLFIPPTPTTAATAIPPTPDFESLYKVGDKLLIVGVGLAPVYLTTNPEPSTRRNRVPNATCYPNTSVMVEAIERAADVIYYRVACNNTPGWVVETSLSLP